MNKNLLTLKNFDKDTIVKIINRALFLKHNDKISFSFSENIKAITLFLEPSTRTLISFNLTLDKLKIYHQNLNIKTSSFKKRESLRDTVLTLKAMGFNLFIIRSNINEFWKELENISNIILINAGSGTHSHPTQALLDAVTIFENYKKLNNLKILIIGDTNKSRVENSNKTLLNKFNCKINSFNTINTSNSIKLLNFKNYEVIIFLRIQHERYLKNDLKIQKSYNEKYGLNKKSLANINDNALILHPGPINCGLEITSDVLSDSRIKILEQVENGIYLRMAVIEYLINEFKSE